MAVNASARETPEPNVAYHLAVALEKAGQRVEAIKLLTKLVTTPAEFGEKADARRLLGELSKS
jgi:thioredoxin-like negative regulator of GroEL